MKRTSYLLLSLFVFSAIAGYLLSKASTVGRVGISLFYRQYSFLKIWWQAGLLVFFVWMIFYFLHRLAQQRFAAAKAMRIHAGAILLALLGFFFTYQDFQHSTSHRWLGERFHLGGYLFWIGWVGIAVFFLLTPKPATLAVEESQ